MYFENENLNSIEDEAEFAITLSGILAHEDPKGSFAYHKLFERSYYEVYISLTLNVLGNDVV